MNKVSLLLRAENKTIGFVPTMGALHEGHLSLIARARKECDVVVASIFVNPTQFNDPRDFEKYPRTVEKDIDLLGATGCDYVFIPETAEEIFPEGYEPFDVDFGGLDRVMEGAHRPGHFKGVANVVARLFVIVQPHAAYFGLKDYQQYCIIKRLVEVKKYPVKIIGINTGRADSGLALSSRNQLLTPEERKIAAGIYEVLQLVRNNFGSRSVQQLKDMVQDFFAQQPAFSLEYFDIVDGNTLQPIPLKTSSGLPMAFIAVRLGKVRLIDNIFLKD